MEKDSEYLREKMLENKAILMPLLKYLSWLSKNRESGGSTQYDGNGLSDNSLSFPVYDSTLMSFVKEASKSPIMDRNYPYVYTRKGLRTHDDERRFIVGATYREWDSLRGILSKYVLGGRTKATLWSEAVTEEIFYLVLSKMKEIIEFWDMPMDL
ncbi:MAG: hypothetical protein IJ608_11780 [Lachnospiraceae bacterium]|nr:hypothetical protein [Lachnospiraceae bacterium]